MTVTTIDLALSRIRSATPESQIAVFFCGSVEKVDCTFASTFAIMHRLRNGDPMWIGSFNQTMSRGYVLERIRLGVAIRADSIILRKSP